jgi:hypothetical protein
MSVAGFAETNFPDYGLENYGLASVDNREPEDWSSVGLLGFGAQMDRPFGMIDGENLGLAMEYDDDDFVGFHGGSPLVRTKMLEMDPREIAYIRRTGRPRLGTVAMSDDGDIYQWTEVEGYGGFFKKLRKKFKKVTGRIVKRARKIRKGITKAAKKMIKKLPGGKYLVKIYNRVKKVAMKLTKPLKKLLGSKIGKYLAPIAAMIPGVGPVVAVAIAGMRRAGQIDKIMKKFKVKRNKKGQPKFSSGKQAKAVKRALTQAAKQQRAGATKGKRRGRRKSARLLKKGSPQHSKRLGGLGLSGY